MEVFNRERDISIRANEGDSIGGVSCENEQLVWVLWKILKGDGNDVSHELFAFSYSIVSVTNIGDSAGPIYASTVAQLNPPSQAARCTTIYRRVRRCRGRVIP